MEREFANAHQDKALAEARRLLPAEDRINGNRPIAQWDAAALLKLIWDAWNEVFGRTLGRAERSLVQELRDVRNRWAHQGPFTGVTAGLLRRARSLVAHLRQPIACCVPWQ